MTTALPRPPETARASPNTDQGAAHQPLHPPHPQHPSHREQRPWAAVVAASLLVLPLGSIYAFSVFLKPLEDLLGASRSELATVFGIAAIFYTLGMNLGPRLFRVAGLAVVLIFCAVVSAGGIGLASMARNFWELAFGYGVLFGLGSGVAYVAMQQGVNLMPLQRPGLVNGYLVSLLPAGAMLATIAFGWGLEVSGVRATLMATAVVLLATGLTTLLLAAYAGMRLAMPPQADGAAAIVPGRRDVFFKLFFVFFVAAAAGLMVLSQAAGIMSAYGGSKALALLATTGITGGIAVARLGGGWLTDRFAVPFVMATAQAVACAGTVLLTLWPTALTAAAALLMVGMGYGIISGATAAAVASYWPKALFGRVAARIYIAWCAAAISLPILAAHIFDITGGYQTAFVLAGAGNVAGVLTALTLPKQAPKQD